MKNSNKHEEIDLLSYYNKSTQAVNNEVLTANNGNWLTEKATPPKLMKNIK